MTVISPPTLFLLSLSKFKGVGPAALKKVAAIPHFTSFSVEKLATAIPQIARSLDGGANWNESQDWAHAQMTSAERHQARILSPLDPEYPALLAQTQDAPFILYVQGTLAAPRQRSVAVIGTRKPTQHGAVVAERITTQFGIAGWSIVSGLAFGCDSLAHQAALDCGAHTVAVLAHGLQMISPPKNERLSQAILAAGGALVSEYPFGQTVQNQQYVKRDRTQAGMALGVVMIQSDIKGGSLYASRASLEYGRWLAVPYPTERDLESGAPKVQANVVIADGPAHESADLLRCTTSALSRVIILRNKEDSISLSESDGIRPFESMSGRSSQSSKTSLLNSITTRESQGAGDGFSRDSLLSAPLGTHSINPAKHRGPPEVSSGHLEETSAQSIEAGEIPAERQAAKPGEARGAEDRIARSSRKEPTLEPHSPPQEALQTPAKPTIEVTREPYESDRIATLQNESATQVFDSKTHSDADNRKATGQPSFDLSLVLPKGCARAPAFGLWSPPKIPSKEFRVRLGNVRENFRVREFYARHKRLQSQLAKLQRKLADAKRPFSHDRLLDFRFDGEEVILHLAQLARSSANIHALAIELHSRAESEDWIKRDSGEQVSTDSAVNSASESRHCLVEDLSSVLNTGLRSLVIDDEDSDAAQTTAEGDIRKVVLHQLVERLNSILKAAFRE